MEMQWWEIVAFIFSILIMLVGLFGTILPVIPGTPLILATAFIYALITGFSEITWGTIGIFALMTIAAQLFEWLSTVFGVKKMGGSYYGVVGSLIGMIAGLLIPGVGIFGFIIGAFVGAVVFEIIRGQEFDRAIRAGFGSFIGFLFSGVLKFVLAATMIGMFAWKILFK